MRAVCECVICGFHRCVLVGACVSARGSIGANAWEPACVCVRRVQLRAQRRARAAGAGSMAGTRGELDGSGCRGPRDPRRRPLLPVVAAVTLAVLVALLPTLTAAADINCASVRYFNEKSGLGSIPKDALKGGGTEVRICPREPSCCTPEMERRLTVRSRREFERALAAALTPLADTLRARATRFDEYFKNLLTTSKRDFHEMFRRTYGIIYEQNAFVFTDLFEELERYYAKGRVDLEEALDNFFSTLYQKMFSVINAQYHFDETYLRCVGEHMSELKPFGDVPAKLSVQLRRAFVATRTFAQSLSLASDVVTNMAKIPPSPECLRALTKMSGCSTCTGLVEVKACNNYCINVMKGCLAYHTQLNTEWNSFVDALDQLVDRLKGPFNIEIVVNPINIKISEAIMNFQESGAQVSHKVFQGCGKPKLGHRRRRDTTELDFGRHSHRNNNHKEESEDEMTLETLVKDIRVKVNDTRQFWANLPYQVCNDDRVAASPALDDSCWNGEKKARYEVQVSKEQRANPEVSIDPSRESVHLNEQLFSIRTVISKLKSAYVGRDVEWIDNEDSVYGSGSGSGDGSDHDDDDSDEPEGSGDDDYHDRRYGGGYDTSGRPDSNRPHDSRNKHPDRPTSGVGSPASLSRLSPARAVSSYLLPIVVVWFGGLFSDWL